MSDRSVAWILLLAALHVAVLPLRPLSVGGNGCCCGEDATVLGQESCCCEEQETEFPAEEDPCRCSLRDVPPAEPWPEPLDVDPSPASADAVGVWASGWAPSDAERRSGRPQARAGPAPFLLHCVLLI